MHNSLITVPQTPTLPLIPILVSDFNAWLEVQDARLRCWLAASAYTAKQGAYSLIPNDNGQLRAVLVTMSDGNDVWALSALPSTLPEGDYALEIQHLNSEQIGRLTLGWALGAYQFTRYKRPQRGMARLVLHPCTSASRILQALSAVQLVRDLINTPAQDLMPEQLADTMRQVAVAEGATFEEIVGEQLLMHNYPLIHAVGRASTHAPRLLDLRWGNAHHPKVTLVGKGVCFDSGGLDLKPSSAMRLMKKDMGGAALALGLGHWIMQAGLPVRLRVLIAAVENAVAGNALRPGDVIRSRYGLTVEIHNTDAEGRLILADALAAAAEEQPEVLLDFATLTGAARVALGSAVPALFCNDAELAEGLLAAAEREQDPLWRLPLHQPYREVLDSKIADIANASDSSYAGAITAALFLKEFMPAHTRWAHVDVMAWNLKGQPGRPEGGEAMGLRAAFAWLEAQYALQGRAACPTQRRA